MKRAINTLALVIVISAFSAPNISLAAANLPADAKQRLEQMVAALKLSDAQRAVVAPIVRQGIQERLNILRAAGIKKGSRPGLLTLMRVRGPIQESRAKTEAPTALPGRACVR